MNSEIRDFHNLFKRRLQGVFLHWNNASHSYHDIDAFLIHLNSSIQELRNLTFALQSHKHLLPWFDAWYGPRQDSMRDDKRLRWIIDSRNKIVKQEDLSVSSIAKISLLNWEEFKLPDMKLNPLLSNEALLGEFYAIAWEGVLVTLASKIKMPLLRINRIWIDNDFPDMELLSVVHYGYDYLSKLILEFASLIWADRIAVHKIKIDSLRDKQEYLFDLKNWYKLGFKNMAIRREDIPEKLKKEAEELFKGYNFKKNKDPFMNLIDTHSKLAQEVLLKQKEFLPTCIYLNDKYEPVNLEFFPFEDRTQKYAHIRKIARNLQNYEEVTSILFVSEVWIVNPENWESHEKNPSLKTAKWEALYIRYFDRTGLIVNFSIPIYRTESWIIFWERTENRGNFNDWWNYNWFLKPIAETWGMA